MNPSSQTQPGPFFGDATHTEVMTSFAPAKPKTISDQIRDIAREALHLSGGRTSYEYADDDITMVGDGEDTTITHAGGLPASESGTGVLTLMATNFKNAPADTQDPVLRAKMQILWKLLDPSLNLSAEVARSNPAVSEYMQERVRVRLEEILEQKVLQNPPRGLDLAMIVNERPALDKNKQPILDEDGAPVMRSAADPVGWARRLLYGSLGATTKRVFHNEKAQLAHFADEAEPDAADGSSRDLSIYRQVMRMELPQAAEDQFIDEHDVREIDQVRAEFDTDEPDDAESWAAAVQGKRGTARLRVDALAVRNLVGFPELTVPQNNSVRRATLKLIGNDPTLAMRSAKAWLDLAEGDPTWDQRAIDDNLLGLWSEFSPAQVAHLLGMGERVPNLLAEAALLQDPRPGRDALKRARNMLRETAQGGEWRTLVGEAFDAYIADHYAAVHAWDNRTDTDEAENVQEQIAATWSALAEQVLTWPSSPAGADVTTVDAIAAWFERALHGPTE